MVDPAAHRVAPHHPGVTRLQHVGHFSHVVVQFGRSYLLITSEEKSTAGAKKEKIQAFSNVLDPSNMAHVERPRLALPTLNLLRRLDNSVFGSSCGNQAHHNMLLSGFCVANACIPARE